MLCPITPVTVVPLLSSLSDATATVEDSESENEVEDKFPLVSNPFNQEIPSFSDFSDDSD